MNNLLAGDLARGGVGSVAGSAGGAGDFAGGAVYELPYDLLGRSLSGVPFFPRSVAEFLRSSDAGSSADNGASSVDNGATNEISLDSKIPATAPAAATAPTSEIRTTNEIPQTSASKAKLIKRVHSFDSASLEYEAYVISHISDDISMLKRYKQCLVIYDGKINKKSLLLALVYGADGVVLEHGEYALSADARHLGLSVIHRARSKSELLRSSFYAPDALWIEPRLASALPASRLYICEQSALERYSDKASQQTKFSNGIVI